jgi:hypothetical protein
LFDSSSGHVVHDDPWNASLEKCSPVFTEVEQEHPRILSLRQGMTRVLSNENPEKRPWSWWSRKGWLQKTVCQVATQQMLCCVFCPVENGIPGPSLSLFFVSLF